MNARILALIAAVAVVMVAGCSSNGLQETLPPGPSQQSENQTPTSNASPDQSEASDASSDDGTPVSEMPRATNAPHQSAPATNPRDNSMRSPAPQQAGLRTLCRHPAQPGRRECDAIVIAHGPSGCNRSAPYCASDLQAAYGLAQAAKTNGKGVTVAVVDAYGYPSVSNDLAVYRKRMRLSACSISNRCLRVVNQSGRATRLPKSNGDTADDWRAQEALDLEMVSALCPNCRLLLVQTNTNKSADLGAGVNAAVALGAATVANSYSGTETNGGDLPYSHAGRVIAASAGNAGFGTSQPCGYSTVVCVGGTTLQFSARGWSERLWRKSASVAISAVADPKTGVAFYESEGGWQQAGGTGVSTPIVAALFALASSSARANAVAWISHHDADLATRAAAKLGLVK